MLVASPHHRDGGRGRRGRVGDGVTTGQADLFARSRRVAPGRCRRELDAEVKRARKDGATPQPAMLAAARSLADSIDAVAEHIAARRAARAEAPTGQLMAHGQLNREYRETLIALLGVSHDRDPLDQLLADFAAAATRDGS